MSKRWGVAQIDPEQRFHDWLMDRVVRFLQTRDRRIFPFTENFNEHQLTAFVRDLREGLSEVTDGGSARKSSATGFITSDQVLRRIIDEWDQANGDWPEGSFPQDPVTALGSSSPIDSPPPRVYVKRVVREPRPPDE
jgi:hypothetical protein